MEQGVYIFKNSDDFLKAMEDIGRQYKTSTPVSLTKEMLSMEDVRKEIIFLKKCELNAFVGYLTSTLIKINVTFQKGNYAITYQFKGKIVLYNELHHYLKQKEWNMV